MSNRRHLTRKPMSTAPQWRRVPAPFDGFVCYQSDLHDGHLSVLVSQEPTGLHLSISHRVGQPPRPGRYPTWDEIADARERFLPQDRTFVMHLPPRSEYVNLHQTTFHLWELQSAERGLVNVTA